MASISENLVSGMDLNEPWISALELFNAGKSSEGY
jgi:hypothetical protein